MANAGAATMALPRKKQASTTEVSSEKSFTPYLPALLFAIMKDFLDIIFFLIMFIPGLNAVGLVLAFVFDPCLAFLIDTLLLLFVPSSASPLARLGRLAFLQILDVIPVVNILPLATFSVLWIYWFDRKAQKSGEAEFIA